MLRIFCDGEKEMLLGRYKLKRRGVSSAARAAARETTGVADTDL
jgi:hypothetical protein